MQRLVNSKPSYLMRLEIMDNYKLRMALMNAIDILTQLHNVEPYTRVEICNALQGLIELRTLVDIECKKEDQAKADDALNELSAYSDSPNWRSHGS